MAQKPDQIDALRSQYAQVAATGVTPSQRLAGYSEEEIGNVPEGARKMGMGCGDPLALAHLRRGQSVLDLGSGAGLDAFIAAQRVGPDGKVIGVDMTPEMVAKANAFAQQGNYRNVEFRLGQIERLPVADASVDIIISNCVINHSPDKLAAFREALRVLRAGGMMFASDLVVEGQLPPLDSPGLEVWKEWLTVACGKSEYLAAVQQAGFGSIPVVEESVYAGPAMTDLLAGKIISLQVVAQK